MQPEELIIIGRVFSLGNGWCRFTPNRAFMPEFMDLKDLFLILPEHRVYIVTIRDKKIEGDGIYFSFEDATLTSTIEKAGRVQLAIDPEEGRKFIRGRDGINPLGLKVIQGEEVIGEIIDMFDNSAHDILIVQGANGREFMIPDVAYYVIAKDRESGVCHVRNVDDLMNL